MQADISKIMTPDRILGALIWQVWNHQLDDQLLDLVRSLPDEFVQGLEGDLDTLVQMARGANVEPELSDQRNCCTARGDQLHSPILLRR